MKRMVQKVEDPCRDCGAVPAQDAAFCALCGTPVTTRATSPAAAQVPLMSSVPAGSSGGSQNYHSDGVSVPGVVPVGIGAAQPLVAPRPVDIDLRIAAATARIPGGATAVNVGWLLILSNIASVFFIAYGLRQPIIAVSYFVPTIGQLLVIISNTWDANGKRRGWHDKLAHSLVFNVKTGRDPLETGGLAERANFVPAAVPIISEVRSPLARPAQGASGQPEQTSPTQPLPQAHPFAPPSTPQSQIPLGSGPITGVPRLSLASDSVQVAALRLSCDDGRCEDISTVALIRRNLAGYDGDMISSRIAVQDSSRSVSKTHLHVHASTTPLVGGARALAETGVRVHFGDRSFGVGRA